MGRIIEQFVTATTLCLLVIQPGFRQKKSDREAYGLVGPVKTVRIDVAKFASESGNWQEGRRIPSCVLTYDESGDIIEDTRYLDGRRQTRNYEKGTITEETNYDARGALEEKTVYSYSHDGKILEEDCYDAKGVLQYKKVHNYGDAGKRVDVATYIFGGSILDGTQSLSYDYHGSLLEDARYGANGSLRLKQTYIYDDRNHLIETVSCNGANQILIKAAYAYDNRDRLTTQSSYEADGSFESKTRFAYDSRDNLVERLHFTADGTLKNRQRSTYDEKGNLTEEAQYSSSDGSLEEKSVYDYKSDAKGNWIKQTKFKVGDNFGRGPLAPIGVTYRTIVYF